MGIKKNDRQRRKLLIVKQILLFDTIGEAQRLTPPASYQSKNFGNGTYGILPVELNLDRALYERLSVWT